VLRTIIPLHIAELSPLLKTDGQTNRRFASSYVWPDLLA